MKSLIVSTLIILAPTFFAKAATYAQVKTKQEAEIYGQPIAEYQPGWFWDKGQKAEGVRAYFYLDPLNKARIKFLKESEIVSVDQQNKTQQTAYFDYLKKHSLFLQGAPLIDSWNYISTGNSGHHKQENMYGDFAWDLVRLKNNKAYQSKGEKNSDFYTWGHSIVSPISGTIVEAVDHLEDHAPDLSLTGDLSKRDTGNYLLLHLKGNFYFIFMHLQKDSIPDLLQQKGALVNVGDYIGKVGNSGITYIPHLHLTLYYWSEALKRFISVPSFFENIEYRNKNRPQGLQIPQTFDFIQKKGFRGSSGY